MRRESPRLRLAERGGYRLWFAIRNQRKYAIVLE